MKEFTVHDFFKSPDSLTHPVASTFLKFLNYDIINDVNVREIRVLSGVAEDKNLLGCCTLSPGMLSPTFRTAMPSSSGTSIRRL
jgi:hypothetical protein